MLIGYDNRWKNKAESEKEDLCKKLVDPIKKTNKSKINKGSSSRNFQKKNYKGVIETLHKTSRMMGNLKNI